VPTNAASSSTSSTPMPPSISSTPMPPCAPTGCSSSSSGQQQPPQPPQPWQWQWQPPALHSPPPQPTAQPGALVGATQARGHQAGDHQGDQGRSREIKGDQGDHYAWAPPAQDQIRQQDQIGPTGLPNMVLGWELPPPPVPPPPALTPYQAALLDQVQKEGQAKVQAAQARLQAHASAHHGAAQAHASAHHGAASRLPTGAAAGASGLRATDALPCCLDYVRQLCQWRRRIDRRPLDRPSW
jgi:hypothetical protein